MGVFHLVDGGVILRRFDGYLDPVEVLERIAVFTERTVAKCISLYRP